MEQINFRASKDQIDRIDAHLAKLQAQMPGVQMTRSDAIRDLVERGLKESEAAQQQQAA